MPDAGRVFGRPAFLDIYNEHCSYFTARSLTTAFEVAGFEVTDAWIEYDGQYLLLTARPGDVRGGSPEPDRDLASSVGAFATRCRPEVQRWRTIVREHASRGARIAVWGSGSKCVAFLSTIGVTDEVDYVVDINPHRHGLHMPGVAPRIEAPEHVRAAPPDLVIVMNPVYLREIGASLADLGVHPRVLAVD